jgi:adenosylmethionine-8-amino-7-oxononanoate aminotransferase
MVDEGVFYRNFAAEHRLIVKGQGAYIYDKQGNRYLQASSGPTLHNVGHGVKEIVDAMAKQALELAFLQLPLVSEPLLRLAARVAAIAPVDHGKVYFTPGGSEANETAIQIALAYHRAKGRAERWRFIGRWQSHHGAGLGAISLGGRPSARRHLEPLLAKYHHIPPPNCYRCWWKRTYPDCSMTCADELERAIQLAGPETVCGFITEAINGPSIAGLTPPPEYYPRIRDICDRHDLLFVVDEVMSGFGRTGENFAIDHWPVAPDMITFGKGVAGGYYPLGGVIVAGSIVDLLAEEGIGLGTTYSHVGDPLGMAVGEAVLDVIETGNLIENAQRQGRYLRQCLVELAEDHPSIGIVRGRGLFLGVEFVKNRVTREPFALETSFVKKLVRLMWDRGISIRGDSLCIDGVAGDEIRVAPPLIISREQADEIAMALDESLTALECDLL